MEDPLIPSMLAAKIPEVSGQGTAFPYAEVSVIPFWMYEEEPILLGAH